MCKKQQKNYKYRCYIWLVQQVQALRTSSKCSRDDEVQASSATVPKISVIIRKAYGAGLYVMCGPAFEPDVFIALTNGSNRCNGS